MALVPQEFKGSVIAIYVSAINSALITIVPSAGVAALTTLLIKNYSLLERSAMKTMIGQEEEKDKDKEGKTKGEEDV